MIIWIIAAIIVFSFFIAYLKSPRFRGIKGERNIRSILGKTQVGKQYVINDYVLFANNRSCQIDHILINQNGIYIVETKNYSGMIYGNEHQLEWTQVLNYGKIKNKFLNPIKQNATHLYNISQLLPKEAPLFSVVVFIKNNVKNIEAENVIGAGSLRELIREKRNQTLSIEFMEKCYNILLENRVSISTKEHIANIKKLQKDISKNICPRCGGNLTIRHGEYGDFYGCENYPKCKFKKNI